MRPRAVVRFAADRTGVCDDFHESQGGENQIRARGADGAGVPVRDVALGSDGFRRQRHLHDHQGRYRRQREPLWLEDGRLPQWRSAEPQRSGPPRRDVLLPDHRSQREDGAVHGPHRLSATYGDGRKGERSHRTLPPSEWYVQPRQRHDAGPDGAVRRHPQHRRRLQGLAFQERQLQTLELQDR